MASFIKNVCAYSGKQLPSAQTKRSLEINLLQELPDGQRFFAQFFLAATARVKPQWISETLRSSYTPGSKAKKAEDEKKTKKKEQKGKKEKLLPKGYSAELHCFSCWFVICQTDDEYLLKHAVEPAEAIRRFGEYWESDTGKSYSKDDLLGIVFGSLSSESMNANAKVIDFRALSEDFFPDSITSEHIRRFLSDVNYPIKENTGKGDVRNLFSKHLGTGQKSDLSWDAHVKEQFLNAIVEGRSLELSPKEIISDFGSRIGVRGDDPSKESFCNYVSGKTAAAAKATKKGRSSFVLGFVQKHWNTSGYGGDKSKWIKFLDLLIKNTQKNIVQCQSRLAEEALPPNPLWPWLKEEVCARLGVQYSAEHFSMMADISTRRIKTYVKSFYNAVDSRFNSWQSLEKHCSMPIKFSWVKDVVVAHKNQVKQPYLRRRQIKGVREVIVAWSKSDGDFERATKEAQSQSIRSLGDMNLYDSLAKAVQDHLTGDPHLEASLWDVRDDLKRLVDIDDAQETYSTTKWPCYVPPSRDSFDRPWFGDSMPALKLERLSVEESKPFIENTKGRNRGGPAGHKPHFNVEISLFVDGTPKMVSIPVHAKRFALENLVDVPGVVEAPRNDKGFQRLHGSQVVQPKKDHKKLIKNVSVSPYYDPRTKDWRMSFAARYESARVDWDTLKQGHGYHVLCLDPGQRTAGAYVILRKVAGTKAHISLTDVECPSSFNIVEWGFLDDILLSSDTFRPYSVLNGGSGDAIPEQIVDLWKQGLKARGRNIPDTVPDFSTVANDLANDLGDYAYKYRTIESESMDFSRMMALLNASLGRIGTERTVRGQGGLSFSRIDKISKLLRSLQSIQKTMENKKLVPPAFLAEEIEWLWRKKNCIRDQRSKRTESAVMKLMLGDGTGGSCKMLVRELTNIEKNETSSKFLNRRASDWCIDRAMKGIDSKCSMYEKFVKRASSYYTSQLCYTGEFARDSGVLKPRYSLVGDSNWNREKSHKDYKMLQSTPSNELSPSEKARLEAWDNFMRDHGVACESRLIMTMPIVGKCYVPGKGGEWFHNPWLARIIGSEDSYVNADINAALNIGVRGLRSFFGELKKNSD